MLIAKNTVVTLNYRVSDPEGNPIDEGKDPLVYLHGGHAGIFPRIEEALEGKEIGEELVVKLQPEEAFGDYDESQVRIEPLELFPENIEVGMRFERMTDDGEDEILYTITDIAEGKVVVDGNHPLAGTAIVFTCTVTEVRPASPEELTHGHAHGPGGHHHH